ncbi:MAG TPA: DUF4097 family beta strand repeat-containing protein [bacterium]|nr:DUF4097 family beta strand repeat-containing protein [bacterium]
MRKKILTALVCFALSGVSFAVAFGMFFNASQAGTAFAQSGISPLFKNVTGLIREGMEPMRGCTVDDFAGDLKSISLSTITAGVRLETITDTAPVLNSDTGVNCQRTGDKLEIRVPPFSLRKRHHAVNLRLPPTDNDDLTLFLPLGKRYDLEVKTISGDIRAEDIAAEKLAVESKSGDISVKGLTGDLTASAVSGDMNLELKELSSFAAAVAVSGDIRLRLPGAEPYNITTETVSGKLSVNASEEKGAQKQVQVKTVSGDIAIEAR